MKTKFSVILTLLLAFVVQLTFAQQQTVSGTVIDESGLPLPGATVLIQGTSTGASTDFDGIYSINVNSGQVLVFSYVGYANQSITVGTSNTIDVQLAPDNALEEVVVVAFGSEKASNVTSAISVVKSESIEQVPVASMDQILQGQAAGLNIQTSSGEPGASGTIILRGRNSIQGNIEPLFLIDGVAVNEDNFRSLNANDIESVSILKDASASALYGNAAAGGVIIVTTKTGKLGSGVKIQYRSLYGQSNVIDPGFKLMNSNQYLTYQRSRGFNSFTDVQIDALSTQTNTKWEDVLMRTGQTLSHEVNITTGGEKSTSFSSLSFFEQEGVVIRSKLKRFTFRNNTTTTSENDKFNFSTNLSIGYVVDDLSGYNTRLGNPGGQLDNPFINAYLGNPALNPYNPDGSLNLTGDGSTGFGNSPIISLNTAIINTDRTEEIKIVGKVEASLEVATNLTAGTFIGMDYEQQNILQITDPNSLRGLNNDTNNPTAALIKGSHDEAFDRTANFQFQTSLTYKNLFNDKHDFEASVFTVYFKEHNRGFGFEAFGLDPKLPGVGAGFTDGTTTEGDEDPLLYNYIPTAYSNKFDGGTFSYFGLVKYDYDSRYGFQASIRRDASSRFAKTNKWGTFWAVSAKWNIHNESFMADNTFFNELKLRASYGTTGNSRAAARFGSFSLVGTTSGGNTNGSGQGYQGTNGYWITQIDNPDLKWETVTQANIGLDFSMWNRKISGTIDVYEKITDDLFLNQPLSTLSGFSSINANVGQMKNQGVELSLRYNVIENNDRRDLQWSVNGNIAYNKNEITKLVGDGLIETGRTALSEGDPFGSFYAVRWAGVSPADGSPLYLDVDGDITNVYSADNRVIIDKTQDPKFVGGFGTNVSYKGFSLNALFTYALDQYRYNGSLALVEDPAFASFVNQSTAILREWQQPGDITDIPAPGFGSTRNLLSTRYLEDASFLRLRNVTLAYNIDRDVLEKTKLFTGLRIYAQVQNLFTWSKWRGFDPESNINSTFFEFPTPRTWTVGIDVNF